ncbi:MAG: hypothetical protein LBN22_11645 [Clostridiales Family XIII bacterium]|nr:hypothetical protein [Clostridiales Family XIII bacterium]
MKRNIWICCFTIEAILCIIISIIRAAFPSVFSSLAAFPFEQIGFGLRKLSLSGAMGNIFAILIYCVFCLIPIACFLFIRNKRKLYPEDGLLVLLSAVLFGVIYLMINPSDFLAENLGSGMPSAGKAVFTGIIYSIMTGYIILRIIRLISENGTKKLYRYMKICLYLLNILFVYLAFGMCFDNLLDSIRTLKVGNLGNGNSLDASYIFLVLQFIGNALPYVLDIWIVSIAFKLLTNMQEDLYSTKTITTTLQLSHICITVLKINILTGIAINVLQLLCTKWLMVIHTSVQFPIQSILFVLATLILTRFVIESKQLKDENDLYI